MANDHYLTGVYAAAVTPLKPDLSPDLDGLTSLIQFLANRGCHGVLLMGTTGEGPSFSINERFQFIKQLSKPVKILPDFQLLAGTGTPSLEDTIFLTKSAFDLGYDGVVVLPPYYFRKPPMMDYLPGLARFWIRLSHRMEYYWATTFPPVSGVSLSLELLSRLKESISRTDLQELKILQVILNGHAPLELVLEQIYWY